jgi:hypothetical protein
VTAALIGLIGVIAGGLLGGAVNAVQERQRRRSAAETAGWLIAAELKLAVQRIESALKKEVWWRGDLATDAWRTRAVDVAADLWRLSRAARSSASQRGEEVLANTKPPTDMTSEGRSGEDERPREEERPRKDERPPTLLERLSSAYGVIDLINSRRVDEVAAQAGTDGGQSSQWLKALAEALAGRTPDEEPPPPISTPDQELLRDAVGGLRDVTTRLEDALRSVRRTAWRSVRRPAIGFAVVAVVILAAFVLLTPRTEFTDQSIAAALKQELPSGTSVDCDPTSGDWLCVARTPDERASCPTAAAPSSGSVRALRASTAAVALKTCARTSKFETTVDGDEAVATALDAASANAIGDLVTRMTQADDERSFFRKAIDAVLDRE